MMHEYPSSWLSPKAHGLVDTARDFRSVVAVGPFKRRETIAVFGGSVVSSIEVAKLSPATRQRTLQIADDHFIVSNRDGCADWINHSCDPNAGFHGPLMLVAMRPIATGEMICFDYAMSDASPYDEFACACGSARCRGHVRANDWQRRALWRRYSGFFSPYIQARIDELSKSKSARRNVALATSV